jgi:DNA-directed RNA polymerase specialized sigma24 family protein
MFVLRFIEDLDNAQIARMLGTSRAVVAVRLHQVRAKLKKDYQSFIRGGK